MRRHDVAVVGEIYMDHVFTGFKSWPKPGEEVFTSHYTQEVGGGGAITACALAKLGRSVCLIGVVGGEDRLWIDRRLSSFGVSIDNLISDKGRTGVTVSLSATEDRSFFTYVGENARLEEILKSDKVVDTLVACRHIHFAMPLTSATANKVFPILISAGCTLSLDVGHHANWLNESANRSICAAVDYFFPNEREAEMLCGAGADSYLDFTRKIGWRNGVVKLGPRGAAMRQGEQVWQVQPPAVEVVDTTGAGDAFDAGFIDAMLDDVTGEEYLRRGCICGGMSVRAAGALLGLPDKKELEALYEQSYGS